jgi:hypothetical protein
MFGHNSGHTGFPRAKYIVYDTRPYAVNNLVRTWDQQDGWESEYMVNHLWGHSNSDGTGNQQESAFAVFQSSDLDGTAEVLFSSWGTPLHWDNVPASHAFYLGIHAFANSSGVYNQMERIAVDMTSGVNSYDSHTFGENWYVDNVDVAIEQSMDNPDDPNPNNTWSYFDYLEIRDVNDNLWDDELRLVPNGYGYWIDNQHVDGIQPAHGENFPNGNNAWLKMQAE